MIDEGGGESDDAAAMGEELGEDIIVFTDFKKSARPRRSKNCWMVNAPLRNAMLAPKPKTTKVTISIHCVSWFLTERGLVRVR